MVKQWLNSVLRSIIFTSCLLHCQRTELLWWPLWNREILLTLVQYNCLKAGNITLSSTGSLVEHLGINWAGWSTCPPVYNLVHSWKANINSIWLHMIACRRRWRCQCMFIICWIKRNVLSNLAGICLFVILQNNCLPLFLGFKGEN